jgi:hypothetical protein
MIMTLTGRLLPAIWEPVVDAEDSSQDAGADPARSVRSVGRRTGKNLHISPQNLKPYTMAETIKSTLT